MYERADLTVLAKTPAYKGATDSLASNVLRKAGVGDSLSTVKLLLAPSTSVYKRPEPGQRTRCRQICTSALGAHAKPNRPSSP